jgi:hypothetical protein
MGTPANTAGKMIAAKEASNFRMRNVEATEAAFYAEEITASAMIAGGTAIFTMPDPPPPH